MSHRGAPAHVSEDPETAPAAPRSEGGGPERPRLAAPGAEERYEVVELLGQGGEGKVWRARDRAMRRDVAVKTLHRKSPEARAEFLEEAQVTAQLDHPNIVPIHEIGVDADGAPYLVMRLVRGRRLSDVLALERERAGDGPLDAATLGRLLRVFREVCLAVDFAHARGVVHRDLKPGNVMIGEFGEVLVLDWGLAKVLRGPRAAALDEADARRQREREERRAAGRLARDAVSTIGGEPGGPQDTVRGVVKGTVAYMAPEQAAGRPDEIDARTDVYSLGAVLYEVLAGKAPFEGPSESAIPAILAGEVVLPSLRAPGREVPAELEAIARKAMSLAKADRYRSAREVREEVESWLDGRLVAAHRYSALARARKWVARHRALAASLALALAVVLGAPPGMRALRERARLESEREEDARQQRTADERAARVEDIAAGIAGAGATGGRPYQAASDAERALGDLAAYAREHRGEIDALASDPLLERRRPDASAKAKALGDAILACRRRALAAIGASALRAIDRADVAPAERGALAESTFARLAPLAREAGLADAFSVADLAERRARLALEEDGADEEARLAKASAWAANAYAAEPRSAGAGRALLLVAQQTARRGQSKEALDQLHLALSAFGREHAALRADALLGMAGALADMGDAGAAPHDPALPARVAALAAALQVVTPQGALRPDVAAALDPANALETEARARDLLFVLRHAAYPALPEEERALLGAGGHLADLDGDGVADAVWSLDRPSKRLRVRRLGPPVAPGGPCALVDERTYDWSDALAGIDTEGAQPWTLRLDGATAAVLWMSRCRRIVLGPIERPRILLDETTPEPATGMVPCDLDGDGRDDVVVPFGTGGRDVRISWRRADGTLEPSAPLRALPPSAPAADRAEVATGSEVVDLSCGDLDGDGRPEVALSLGAWNHFSVEVWRAGPGRVLTLAARRRVGRAHMCVVDDGRGGRALLLNAGLGRGERRFFELRGEAAPDLGFSAWRLEGSALVRAPELEPRGVDDLGYTGLQPLHEGGRRGLVARTEGIACFLFAGEGGAPRTLRVRGGALRPAGPIWVRVDTPYRDATEEELEALSRRPVPEDLTPAPTAPEARTAIFLARFGLPDEAARAASDALAATPSAEARVPLARTLLQSLEARGREVRLQAALEALEPEDALALDAITAADAIAAGLDRAGDAARILERWAGAKSVLPQARRQLSARAARWRRVEALLSGAPAVAWDLRGVRARSSAGAGAGPLAGRVLCGDASLALRPEGDGLRVRQQRRLGEPDVRAGPGGASLAGDGDASRRFLGVPLRFRGGPWRMVADVVLDDVRWSGVFTAGLMPARELWSGDGPQTCAGGFVVRRFGGNGVDWMDVEARPWVPFAPGVEADTFLGRRLRIVVRGGLGDDEVRVAVWDAASRAPLGEARSPGGDLRADLYLLGLVPEPILEPTEGRLLSVAFWGDADLVPEGDREVAALRAALPGVEAHTQAARALLSGKGEEAARSLEGLAGTYDAVAKEAAEAARPRLAKAALRARIDAALARDLREGGDGARLARALGGLVRSEEDVETLLDRVCGLPQAPGWWERALTLAAGETLYAHRSAEGRLTADAHMDLSRRVRQDLAARDAYARAAAEAAAAGAQAPAPPEFDAARADEDALVAAWLAAALPLREEGARALEVDALVRALPASRYDWRSGALQSRLIAQAPRPLGPQPPSEERLALARALDAALRRADAIALLEATGDLPRRMQLALDLHREMSERAVRHAAMAREAYARREPRWPEAGE